MPNLRLTLSAGIVANYGRTTASSLVLAEARNVVVTDAGHLQRRGGSSRPLVTSELGSIPSALIRAYEALPILTTPAATNAYRHFLCYILSTAALQRWDETSAWAEVQIQQSTGDLSFRPFNRDYLYPAMVFGSGRVFLGTSNASDRPAWVDLRTTSTPSAYTLGGNTNPPVDPTVAASASGNQNDLTAVKWYGVCYTFYNSTYGIETRPSTQKAAVTTAGNKSLTLTLTRDVDQQFDFFRVYRTESYDTQADAEDAISSYVGEVAHTPGAGTVTAYLDATTLTSVLTGSIDPAASTSVVGVGTLFLTELAVGDQITVSAETRTIATITTNTALTVTVAFSNNANDTSPDRIDTYELGGAQDTATHYPFGGATRAPASFLAFYNQMLWGVARPRSVWHSRVIAEAVYPDAFPLDHTFPVGEGDDEITGLVELPSGRQLAAFTQRYIQLIQGTDRSNIDRSTRIAATGCPFPRSLAVVQDQVMFLGTDLQIWATDGQTTNPVSGPVNTFLSHIEPAWKWLPVATSYKNQYRLSFPSGTAVTTSSVNTTVAAGSTSIFSGTVVKKKITDASAWDLSAVKVGMLAQIKSKPQNNAIVSQVDDAANWIETEDWRSDPPVSGDQIEIIANDRVLIFDRTYGIWLKDHGPNVNCWSHWTGQKDRGELFAGLSSGGYVDQVVTTATTDTGSVAITSYLKTAELFFERVVILDGVFFLQPVASAVTITVYINGASSSALSRAYTPAEEMDFFCGFEACEGHTFVIEFSASAMAEVQAVLVRVGDL